MPAAPNTPPLPPGIRRRRSRPGLRIVATMLEHPSVYDAMTYYSQIHGCELRVAGVNKQSGGVDADAVIREIVNYVSGLGAKIALAGSDRRRLFETGMSRTASHDRALLGLALEGSGLAKGLRTPMDGAPLCQRDFIIGIRLSAPQKAPAPSAWWRPLIQRAWSACPRSTSILRKRLSGFFWLRRRLQECRWAFRLVMRHL